MEVNLEAKVSMQKNDEKNISTGQKHTGSE